MPNDILEQLFQFYNLALEVKNNNSLLNDGNVVSRLKEYYLFLISLSLEDIENNAEAYKIMEEIENDEFFENLLNKIENFCTAIDYLQAGQMSNISEKDITKKFVDENASLILKSIIDQDYIPYNMRESKYIFQLLLANDQALLIAKYMTSFIDETFFKEHFDEVVEGIDIDNLYHLKANLITREFLERKKEFFIKIFSEIQALDYKSLLSNKDVLSFFAKNVNNVYLLSYANPSLIDAEMLENGKTMFINFFEHELSLEKWVQNDAVVFFILDNVKNAYRTFAYIDFTKFSQEQLDKYHEIIFRAFSNFNYLLGDMKINATFINSLFKYVDDKKKLVESIIVYKPELITPNFLKKFQKQFEEYFEEEHIYLHSGVRENYHLAKFIINKTSRLDIIFKYFPQLVNDDFIRKYGDKIVSIISSKSIDFSDYKSSPVLFELILTKTNKANILLDYFPDFFTKENFLKYENDFIRFINGYFHSQQLEKLKNNKDFFDFIAEKTNRVDLILNYHPEYFTLDYLTRHKKKCIDFFEYQCTFLPPELFDNRDLMLFILDNTKASLLILKYCKSIITPEIVMKYQDIFLKCFKDASLDLFDGYQDNLAIFNLIHDHLMSRIDVLLMYHPELITPDDILNNTQLIIKTIDEKIVSPKAVDNHFLLDLMIENTKIIPFYYEFFSNHSNLQYISKKIGIDSELLKYKLDYLYQKNDELFSTLNIRILKIDEIKMDVLLKLVLYQNIQDSLLLLDSKSLRLVGKMFDFIKSGNIDVSSIYEKILLNIKRYEKLFENVEIENLNDEQLKNLITLLQYDKEIFQINSVHDLLNVNFVKIREKYFHDINLNIDVLTLDEVKEALFQKMYGISLSDARFIYERYYCPKEELVKTGLDLSIINMIEEISHIVNESSLENLKVLFENIPLVQTDFLTLFNLEAFIRKAYAKLYNSTLYQPNPMHLTKSEKLMSVTYNGKNIPIYEMDGDFNMQIHALGAYRAWTRPVDFKNDWLRPKISYHGICTSYISNSQIATARPNHPILGFSHYEEGALLLAGNYDLYSDGGINTYSTAIFQPYKFLPPELMINKTRHNHNEMVIERLNANYKRLPDYIVYLVDDINNEKNFSEDNEFYQETLQAAHDFDLPIVIVDRLKYAIAEKKVCCELEKTFYKTGNLTILKEVFLRMMNNSVGCRSFTGEVANYQKEFSSSEIRAFYQRIKDFILKKYQINDNINIDDALRNEGIKTLMFLKSLLMDEHASYDVSHSATRLSPPLDLEKEILDIEELIDKLINVDTKGGENGKKR